MSYAELIAVWEWKRFKVIRPRKIDGKMHWLTYAYRYPSPIIWQIIGPIIWPWMTYEYKSERQFIIDELKGKND
jgi:hypothetical protein